MYTGVTIWMKNMSKKRGGTIMRRSQALGQN